MLWEADIPERPPQQPIHQRLVGVRFQVHRAIAGMTEMRALCRLTAFPRSCQSASGPIADSLL